MPGTSRCDLCDDVTFATFVGTPGDRMFGVATRPEAEAVMVLGGQDQLLEPTRLEGGYDLVGIEIGWVEDRGIFITRSPFAVRECVDREVYETVGFQVMPCTLPRGGQWTVGFGSCSWAVITTAGGSSRPTALNPP
jgi:hypothetical protein